MMVEKEVKTKSTSRRKPELWVKRTLEFEMEKKMEEYLEDLAKLCGTTVDEILREELRGIFGSFWTGGYLDTWIEEGMEKRGLSEYLER